MENPEIQSLLKLVDEVYKMLDVEFHIWSTTKNETVEKIREMMKPLVMIRSCDNSELFKCLISTLPSNEDAWRMCFRAKRGNIDIDVKRERACKLMKTIFEQAAGILNKSSKTQL